MTCRRIFLKEIGLSTEAALVDHRLAPLGMRRDIAMLGLLHKISLGVAPKPLLDLFSTTPRTLQSFGFATDRSRHTRQLHDPVEHSHPPIIKRSLFGLVSVYNQLPQSVVSATSVKTFQSKLQWQAKDSLRNGFGQWSLMYHASV